MPLPPAASDTGRDAGSRTHFNVDCPCRRPMRAFRANHVGRSGAARWSKRSCCGKTRRYCTNERSLGGRTSFAVRRRVPSCRLLSASIARCQDAARESCDSPARTTSVAQARGVSLRAHGHARAVGDAAGFILCRRCMRCDAQALRVLAGQCFVRIPGCHTQGRACARKAHQARVGIRSALECCGHGSAARNRSC